MNIVYGWNVEMSLSYILNIDNSLVLEQTDGLHNISNEYCCCSEKAVEQTDEFS